TYARNFKKRFEGKEEGEIETEIENYSDLSVFTDIKRMIESTREQLIEVDRPIFIAQGKKDNVINPKSADIIYDEVDSEIKEIKVYENSGHVLPIDNDKEAFFEDYYEFLKINIKTNLFIRDFKDEMLEIIDRDTSTPMTTEEFESELEIHDAEDFKALIKALVSLEESDILRRTKNNKYVKEIASKVV